MSIHPVHPILRCCCKIVIHLP